MSLTLLLLGLIGVPVALYLLVLAAAATGRVATSWRQWLAADETGWDLALLLAAAPASISVLTILLPPPTPAALRFGLAGIAFLAVYVLGLAGAIVVSQRAAKHGSQRPLAAPLKRTAS